MRPILGSEIDTFSESYLQDGPGGTGDRPLYDHSNPAMRKWWIDHALLMDSDNAIDGVFADNTRGPATTLKSEMIKDLADTLPAGSLKLGNFIRQRDDDGNRFRMNYEEGTYFENQHIGPVNQPDHESIVVSMQLAREASWKQKVVMWNGSRRNCGCFDGIADSDIPPSCVGFINVDDEPRDLIMQDLELSLAEYLMVAEEYSYFGFNVSPDASCERWRWDSSGLPQFQKPLGEPVGPPIRDGNTFARHFEFVSVKIDFETEETTFDWHDTGDFPTAAPFSHSLLPTQAPVSPTQASIAPSDLKIESNVPSQSPSDSTSTTTRILLSASGFDPITSNSICPAQEATAVVIDGSAYTGGPGTIRLYQCTFINDEYDLMKIELIGFESGLWFEIAYNVGSIDLKITSLDDYSGYWTRVKNSYVGDYPFQTSTDHYPQFSWETVPRWISFRRNPNSGPFTQEDIATIANNNYLSWYGLGRPEDVINMAESIKAINPHYKMLLYWNSESYWGESVLMNDMLVMCIMTVYVVSSWYSPSCLWCAMLCCVVFLHPQACTSNDHHLLTKSPTHTSMYCISS